MLQCLLLCCFCCCWLFKDIHHLQDNKAQSLSFSFHNHILSTSSEWSVRYENSSVFSHSSQPYSVVSAVLLKKMTLFSLKLSSRNSDWWAPTVAGEGFDEHLQDVHSLCMRVCVQRHWFQCLLSLQSIFLNSLRPVTNSILVIKFFLCRQGEKIRVTVQILTKKA